MKRLFISGSLLVAVICGLVFLWAKSGGQAPAALAGDRASGEAADKPPAPGEPGYAEYRHSQRRLDRSFDWRRPRDVYGEVVDEHGEPVSGARIRFSWNDMSEKGSSKAETTSDARGFFSLRKRQGKVMTLSVEKEG